MPIVQFSTGTVWDHSWLFCSNVCKFPYGQRGCCYWTAAGEAALMAVAKRFIITGIICNFQKTLISRSKVHPAKGHEGPEWSKDIALRFFNLGARWGWVFNATPRPLYLRRRPGIHCIGGWVGPRTGLDGCGNSRPLHGNRSPDRPVRSESMYRLSYPGP